MATIDPRFICTSDLEEILLDNSSGLPLSGGIVTFYSDVNRTSLKPVYQLSGTPGNYNYDNPLPNPCTLSSSGTFQDALGNNIVPYYYPFTGTPEDNSGVQELYYITVVNSGFVPQFVRQAWPQSAGSMSPTPSDVEITNYIPNGQFLAYNKIISISEPPVSSLTFTNTSGSTAIYSQAIAQGGWNFVYDQSSTATFSNSFSQIPISGGWGMNSFPRNVFNFNCTGIGNKPTYRDLRIIWPDVNKFSSGNPPGSTSFTLFFDAKSNDGNSYTFNLYQFYYYGTGGITNNYVENFIGTVTIGPSTTFVSININDITFPPNEGAIGSNNDDHVGLALRGPNSGWNVAVSDFVLAQGTEIFTSFPIQTNDEMLSRGVAGWMPTPDPTGMDLYLPLILTPSGMKFDHSIVGQIISKTQLSTNTINNELLMDGSTYVSSAYSTLGIPYLRMANYLISNCAAISVTNGSGTSTLPAGYCPMFGTGPNFVTIFVNATAGKFDLSMNTASGSNLVNNQTSGFTHTSADPLYVFTVGSVPTAGTYFSFTVATSGPLTYNVWFTFNGAGSPPTAPNGANIEVDLVTADTVATTIKKIALAVNSYQFQLIDLRGYFLRGLDPSATTDPDAASRTSPGILDNTNAWTGAYLGSLETGAFASHNHPPIAGGATAFQMQGGTGSGDGSSGGAQAGATTGNTGGNETRPVNIAVYFYIKY